MRMRTIAVPVPPPGLLPIPLRRDPLRVDPTQTQTQAHSAPTPHTHRSARAQKADSPLYAAHLPPLDAADDAAGLALAAEGADEVRGGGVAGGHGHAEADDVDPGRGGRAGVGEALEFFDCVSAGGCG